MLDNVIEKWIIVNNTKKIFVTFDISFCLVNRTLSLSVLLKTAFIDPLKIPDSLQ